MNAGTADRKSYNVLAFPASAEAAVPYYYGTCLPCVILAALLAAEGER